MERIDKLLAKELNIPRSAAKALLKQKRVTLNGAPVLFADAKYGEGDTVALDGKALSGRQYVYIMLNKPQGYVSATEDQNEKTVLELLPEEMRRKGLFPAGRLDKDTTGFLLLTDDGAFAHRILSPKKHIEKTYLARLDKPIDDAVIADFEQGMALGDEMLLPAKLRAVNNDNTLAEVKISQGIYHQVKRMFQKHGITVLALQRTAMGKLPLDPSLREGECRYLSEDEVEKIIDKSI